MTFLGTSSLTQWHVSMSCLAWNNPMIFLVAFAWIFWGLQAPQICIQIYSWVIYWNQILSANAFGGIFQNLLPQPTFSRAWLLVYPSDGSVHHHWKDVLKRVMVESPARRFKMFESTPVFSPKLGYPSRHNPSSESVAGACARTAASWETMSTVFFGWMLTSSLQASCWDSHSESKLKSEIPTNNICEAKHQQGLP